MSVSDETSTATDGIILSDAAAAKVKALLDQEGRDDLALRVAVQPGGCSGLRYQLFFDERSLDGDKVSTYDGFEVVVDRMSVPYLTGATIDFADRIEPISRGARLAAELFHGQPARFFEQHVHGASPRLREEVGRQLRVAVDGRFSEPRADRLELRLRQTSRRECISKRAQPLLDHRCRRNACPGDIGCRRLRRGEFPARVHSPRDVSFPEPREVLHERRAGAQTLSLREPVVAELA